MDRHARVDIQYIGELAYTDRGMHYWIVRITGEATFYKVNAQKVRAALGGGKHTTERRMLRPLTDADRTALVHDDDCITAPIDTKEQVSIAKNAYQHALTAFAA